MRILPGTGKGEGWSRGRQLVPLPAAAASLPAQWQCHFVVGTLLHAHLHSLVPLLLCLRSPSLQGNLGREVTLSELGYSFTPGSFYCGTSLPSPPSCKVSD